MHQVFRNPYPWTIGLSLLAVVSAAQAVDPGRALTAQQIQVFRSGGTRARQQAMNELAARGRKDTQVLRDLVQALEDKDEFIRGYAAGALAKVGREAVPFLVEALASRSAEARTVAASALYTIGPLASGAVPALRKCLQDPDPEVRQAVVSALAQIEQEKAVPRLVEVLKKDADSRVWCQVLTEFASLGPKAGAAVPAILDMLKANADDEGVDGARAAMGAIGALAWIGADAVPGLVAILKGDKKKRRLRLDAMTALAQMASVRAPEAAKEAAGTMVEGLRDEDAEIRHWADIALQRLGPRAAGAAPALRKMVKEGNGDQRLQGARLLALIDRSDPLGLPLLLQDLKQRDVSVRRAAASAIGSLQPPAKEAMPAWKELLKDKDADVRSTAAAALGWLGPSAKDAVPALKELLKDKDADVRRNATNALRMIQGSD